MRGENETNSFFVNCLLLRCKTHIFKRKQVHSVPAGKTLEMKNKVEWGEERRCKWKLVSRVKAPSEFSWGYRWLHATPDRSSEAQTRGWALWDDDRGTMAALAPSVTQVLKTLRARMKGDRKQSGQRRLTTCKMKERKWSEGSNIWGGKRRKMKTFMKTVTMNQEISAGFLFVLSRAASWEVRCSRLPHNHAFNNGGQRSKQHLKCINALYEVNTR